MGEGQAAASSFMQIGYKRNILKRHVLIYSRYYKKRALGRKMKGVNFSQSIENELLDQ